MVARKKKSSKKSFSKSRLHKAIKDTHVALAHYLASSMALARYSGKKSHVNKIKKIASGIAKRMDTAHNHAYLFSLM